MLQFDQESQAARQSGAIGVSGTPLGRGRELDALAREIEETQRQQSETMSQIVERLRAVDAARVSEPQKPNAGERGDEPWDGATAEALMQSYEAYSEAGSRGPAGGSASRSPQDWIGARFNDVTQRITQAISDLKPGSTASLLETRLDEFQAHISAALADVVRRADLEGMRQIEVHVDDLGHKLDVLERHVSRLDGIESDVRNVMEQVSDERIAKLLDYDSRFAADLEAVALRAAEQVQIRFDQQDDAQSSADTRRHDELRALIEASIDDRRRAEAQSVSLVTGLSGRLSEQSDRYDELRGLIEQAMQEQRQGEQAAIGMLETLQQALVTVLDRMDDIEQKQQFAVVPATPPSASEPMLGPPIEPYHDDGATGLEPASFDDTHYSFRDTRYDAVGARGVTGRTARLASRRDGAGRGGVCRRGRGGFDTRKA